MKFQDNKRIVKTLAGGATFWFFLLFFISFADFRFELTIPAIPSNQKSSKEKIEEKFEERTRDSFFNNETEDLSKINPEIYKICQNILKDPWVGKNNIKIKVDTKEIFVESNNCMISGDFIVIGKDFLNEKFLDVAIAHEIGHYNYNYAYSGEARELFQEIKADHFAVLIFGKEKVVEALSYFEKVFLDLLEAGGIDDIISRNGLAELTARKKILTDVN